MGFAADVHAVSPLFLFSFLFCLRFCHTAVKRPIRSGTLSFYKCFGCVYLLAHVLAKLILFDVLPTSPFAFSSVLLGEYIKQTCTSIGCLYCKVLLNTTRAFQ